MSKRSLKTVLLFLLSLQGYEIQAAQSEPPGLGSHLSADYTQSTSHKSAVIDRLMSRAEPGSRVRIIIGLDHRFAPVGLLNSSQRNLHRQKIKRMQTELAAKLTRGRFAEKHRFKNIPFLALEIDTAQLARLNSMPEIASIEEDVLARPSLASSNAVIGSPDAWSGGYNGELQTIAILDTGIDASHPYFNGGLKIVSEACFSTNSPGQGATSACPGGVESSTATGSGGVCSSSDCNHGTHVAGIAAGNDGTGPNFGVASGADLIAVQVFSNFVNTSLCGSSQPCSLSYSSDQIAALEHVYSLAATYDIAAVNMSLGAGAYSGYCDVSEVARKAAIDNLRTAGIATIIASGNSSSRNALQSPACISSSISVGATADNDQVAGFSNVSDFLSLLAPGVSITSAVPGGSTRSLNGTSMSAPHVAGAWAVLKQKYPSASVDEILEALYATGSVIDDNRAGGVVSNMRRINVDHALDLDQPQIEPDLHGTYVPIPGCRIVDTRQTGLPLRPGVTTPFLAGKTDQDLQPQGGAPSGCGVHDDATAVHLNFTVITQNSPGYLRSWPFGQTEPNATMLSWNGGSATNAITLPICTGAACASDFAVKLYKGGQSDELVIDIFGYYLP